MSVMTWGSTFHILFFSKKQMDCFLLFLLFKQRTLKSLSRNRLCTFHQWSYSSRRVLVNEEISLVLGDLPQERQQKYAKWKQQSKAKHLSKFRQLLCVYVKVQHSQIRSACFNIIMQYNVRKMFALPLPVQFLIIQTRDSKKSDFLLTVLQFDFKICFNK